jgi:hypothetical protein
MRSLCSAFSMASEFWATVADALGDSSAARTGFPKPMLLVVSRSAISLSSPTNAPPQMNKMFVVSIAMNSPLGFFRPPFSGTFTTVPSSIRSSACWTPSPLTSREMLTESDLRVILSISSIYTIPCWVAAASYLHDNVWSAWVMRWEEEEDGPRTDRGRTEDRWGKH